MTTPIWSHNQPIKPTMKLNNKEIHDNLIALGYELYTRDDTDDLYWHDDNDDWFGINSKGHINPLDLCEFTEGSIRGQRIYNDFGPNEFMVIHSKD